MPPPTLQGARSSGGSINPANVQFAGSLLGNDGQNAAVCLHGIPSPSAARAAVPLLLDMGYTRLELDVDGMSLAGIGTKIISRPLAAGDKDGYYDDGGTKTWV